MILSYGEDLFCLWDKLTERNYNFQIRIKKILNLNEGKPSKLYIVQKGFTIMISEKFPFFLFCGNVSRVKCNINNKSRWGPYWLCHV